MDAEVPLTSGAEADGQGVWSWSQVCDKKRRRG
jgi:hypothetical protein